MMTTISNLEKKRQGPHVFLITICLFSTHNSEYQKSFSSPVPLVVDKSPEFHFFASSLGRFIFTYILLHSYSKSSQPVAYPVDRARAPTWILTLCHVSWLTYFLGYSLVLTLVFQSGPSRHCNTDHGRWWVSDLLMHQEAASVVGSRLPGSRSPPLGCCALYLASPLKNWRKNSFNPPKAYFIESRWLVRILQD